MNNRTMYSGENVTGSTVVEKEKEFPGLDVNNKFSGSQLPFRMDEHFQLNIDYDDFCDEPIELDFFSLFGSDCFDDLEKVARLGSKKTDDDDLSRTKNGNDHKTIPLDLSSAKELEELINFREDDYDDTELSLYDDSPRIYFLPPPPPLPNCRSVSPEPEVRIFPILFDHQEDEDEEEKKRRMTGSEHGHSVLFDTTLSDPNFSVHNYHNMRRTVSSKGRDYFTTSPCLNHHPSNNDISKPNNPSFKTNFHRGDENDETYQPEEDESYINLEHERSQKPKKRERKPKKKKRRRKHTNTTTTTRKKKKKRISTLPKKIYNNSKKRRKSQMDNGQILCCVKECQNTVENRLRFSLRCLTNEKSDFKVSFLSRSWDKVCHYHYFSDLYKFKKLEKVRKEKEEEKKKIIQSNQQQQQQKKRRAVTQQQQQTNNILLAKFGLSINQ